MCARSLATSMLLAWAAGCLDFRREPPRGLPDIVIAEDLTFDVEQQTFFGNDGLEEFISFNVLGVTASEWRAELDVGQRSLRINEGVRVKVQSTPLAGTNRTTPGLTIRAGGDITVGEDALIELVSSNQPTGRLVLEAGRRVLLDGALMVQVLGTNDGPGEIAVSAGEGLVTGAGSSIASVGTVGGDLRLVSARGDVTLAGYIHALYQNDPASTCLIEATAGAVSVDATTIVEAAPRVVTTGILLAGRRNSTRAGATLDIAGHTGLTVRGAAALASGASMNFGALAVKKIDVASGGGGRVFLRSAAGPITLVDRAVDVLAFNNENARVHIEAHGDVTLQASEVPNYDNTIDKTVVDAGVSITSGTGGVVVLTSRAGSIMVRAGATLDAEGNGTAGSVQLLACTGVEVAGTVIPASQAAALECP